MDCYFTIPYGYMKEKGRLQKKYRSIQCLNCSASLDVLDRYCHYCEQLNTIKKLTFIDLFSEFLYNLFSYDSRLSHTLIALLFSPEKISKEYIAGKRMKYVNPFRFYLSIAIIFFLSTGFLLNIDSLSSGIQKGIDDNTTATEKRKNHNTALTSTTHTDTISRPISSKKPSILLNTENKKLTENPNTYKDSISWFTDIKNKWQLYRNHYKETSDQEAQVALERLKHSPDRKNKYLYNSARRIVDIEKNYGREYAQFLFSKLPLIIFFFLPFFAVCLWLLYSRRNFTYMEHLVFTFHTQTLFFILMGLGIFVNLFFDDSELPVTIALLVFLYYLYRAMRRFYSQQRGKTIVKFLLANVLFFILATFGSIITILGSIFIF